MSIAGMPWARCRESEHPGVGSVHIRDSKLVFVAEDLEYRRASVRVPRAIDAVRDLRSVGRPVWQVGMGDHTLEVGSVGSEGIDGGGRFIPPFQVATYTERDSIAY